MTHSLFINRSILKDDAKIVFYRQPMTELSLSTRDMDIHIALTMCKLSESALPCPTWVNKDGEASVLRDDLVASIRKDIDANKKCIGESSRS